MNLVGVWFSIAERLARATISSIAQETGISRRSLVRSD
jgi:DNA-binding phage protein